MIDESSKLYAAFCAGLVDVDATKTGYPIIENALLAAGLRTFSDVEAKRVLDREFGEVFPIGVIRQILTDGLKKMRLKKKGDNYRFVVDGHEADQKTVALFQARMDELIGAYVGYCKENDYPCESSAEARQKLIGALNCIDVDILIGSNAADAMAEGKIEFSLYKFIEHCSCHHSDLFKFICDVCQRNLIVESLLYAPTGTSNLRNLTIYLDTPIVYALLGLSDDASCDLYARMVTDLQSIGCRVMVMDRNQQEIDQALNATIDWAFSVNYSVLSASRSARIIRKKWHSALECRGAVMEAEKKLRNNGIVVRPTEYCRSEDRYQIDETALSECISKLYGSTCADDETTSRRVAVDAVAIGMIYRMRHGNVAFQLEYANHLLLTSNVALAKAAKRFERSMHKGRMPVPACVHADLVAMLLWMRSDKDMDRYRKERMLALCSRGTELSPEIRSRFATVLEKRRAQAKISDEIYLLLRCGAVAEGAIMRVTQGNPSNVTDEALDRILKQLQEPNSRRTAEERAQYEEQLAEAKKSLGQLKMKNAALVQSRDKLETDAERNRERCHEKALLISLWCARGFAVMGAVAVGVIIAICINVIMAAVACVVLLALEFWRIRSKWSLIALFRRKLTHKLENWLMN